MKDTALQSGYAAILNHDLKVIVIYIFTNLQKRSRCFILFQIFEKENRGMEKLSNI